MAWIDFTSVLILCHYTHTSLLFALIFLSSLIYIQIHKMSEHSSMQNKFSIFGGSEGGGVTMPNQHSAVPSRSQSATDILCVSVIGINQHIQTICEHIQTICGNLGALASAMERAQGKPHVNMAFFSLT